MEGMGPFESLEAARDRLREFKNSDGLLQALTVWITPGDYPRTTALQLTAEDSGSPTAPITWRAVEEGKTRLLGGAIVETFEPVTDADLLARLPEVARAEVRVADLKAVGIADYGTPKRRGFGIGAGPMALELFFNDQAMTPARWPNEGWARIAGVPEGQEGVFQFEEDRPAQWSKVEDIWIHGYWTWDWADSYENIAAIDPATKTITTVAPHGVYGYKKNARFYAQHVLEELDMPGEYYLDRDTGRLYFWPPASLEGAEVAVTLLGDPFIVLDGASNVIIDGLRFEYGRGQGVKMGGGTGNRIRNCAFANLGTLAVSLDGIYNGVEGCTIYGTGEGGITINGGDRATLTPGANYAVSNHIYDYSRIARTYRPAVHLHGVRNRAAHNHIHDAPHMAIGLSGNEHIIEYNDIHHVCMETSDSGAFYMGRDWTQRQNIIRFNYFHELGHGDVQAIYLDDWSSDTFIYGNIIYKGGRGILVGGGRDNVIDNNIFVECTPAIHIDQRGLGWAAYYFDGTTTTLFDRFAEMKADQPPYSTAYPRLQDLLQDAPPYAKYNHVVRNVFYGGRWLDLHNDLKPEQVDLRDNWTEGDPGFVDAAAENFQLREDSPVWKLGFQRIPTEKIGLLR
jgi:parallel beta-helix repeat protein